MPITSGLFATALAASSSGAASVDLSLYEHTATYALPPVAASEASAVTYNWDTGTLFVIGDEGEAIVEVSTQGEQISAMTLTGFDDTEGLTYLGGGEFVVAEERIQDVFKLAYVAGGSVNINNLDDVSLGPNVGNVGLEGVSFDPSTGKFVLVKEKNPQRVIEAAIDFSDETAIVEDLFDPGLGVSDLSDVQVLSTVPSMAGGPDADHMLIYSQESAVLMEVGRSGEVFGTFDFSGIAGDVEGVTIGPDGTIYLVGEAPELYVLTPIPAPSVLAVFGAGALIGTRRRR